MNKDKKYMNKALELAGSAAKGGDIPVGAVVVYKDEVIGIGYNKREYGHNATAHAEVEAINNACQKLKSWRLSDCELYVTLEPCPMCAGAIINSRIKRVIYGAKDAKAGAFGSVLNMNSYPLNHKAELTVGICEKECSEILTAFFKKLRVK